MLLFERMCCCLVDSGGRVGMKGDKSIGKRERGVDHLLRMRYHVLYDEPNGVQWEVQGINEEQNRCQ